MRPQMLPLIVVVLISLFLVGCGSTAPTAVSEAPAATSEPEQAAATSTPEPPPDTPTPEPPPVTPTPEPPTATPIPPTATPIPPTPTPEPPTATPTPAANLSEGAIFTLGPAEVEVVKVTESMTSPIEKHPPSEGMKFVLVELKVIKLEDELSTDHFVFETASGKKPEQLGIWSDDKFGKLETGMGGSTTVSGLVEGGVAINVYFEFPKDEDISTLNLSYR